jgi:phosphonate transport system ATP-binding protein
MMRLTERSIERAEVESETGNDSQSACVAPALEARDLWFSYQSGLPVLKGVSLAASRGEVTMILGLSGGGKTTLLKLAKGLLGPERGSIETLGYTPPTIRNRAARLDHRTAYIPQQLGLVRNSSALENALTGALWRMGAVTSLLKLFPRDVVERARLLLDSLGIGHKADEKVYSLSGGERQRVAIARALMQEPELVLADEFVSQLDPVTSAEIMEIMRETARRGVALVMTTHQLEIVSRYADRVILLREGAKVADLAGNEADLEELRRMMKT